MVDLDENPARPLTVAQEIEMMDQAVRLAGLDEHKTQFDPETNPKPPHAKEEGVTDAEGQAFEDVNPAVDSVAELDAADLSAEDLRLDVL